MGLLHDGCCPYRKGKSGCRRNTQEGMAYDQGERSRADPPSEEQPDNALTTDFWAAGVDSKLLWHGYGCPS